MIRDYFWQCAPFVELMGDRTCSVHLSHNTDFTNLVLQSSFSNIMSLSKIKSILGGNPLVVEVASGEWQRARQMIEENGNLVRKWSVAPSLTGGVAASNILPIHQACKMDDVSVQFVEALLWAYPESIRKRETGFRRVALHIAIRARVSNDVIFYLIDKYPEAVATQDVLGRVPLHYAISNHSPMEIINTLISSCPATSRAADNLGWTPLHVAANCSRSAEMVETLIQCGSESVVSTTTKGNTPLMVAMMSTGPDRELIKTILVEEEQKFEKTAYFRNYREAENNARAHPPYQSSERMWGVRKLKRSSSFRLVV
jgi:hypothetical protein